MSIELKDITKAVIGVATIVNSFFDEDALDVKRDSNNRTSVKLKGNTIGADKVNFGLDFEDNNTRVNNK